MPYRRFLIPAVLLIAAAAVIGTLLFVWRPFETATSLRTTPSVVLAVRDLARLETAEYHIERVVDLRDRQSLLFGLIRTQDAILFVAVGQVTAGVDLGALADGDIIVDQARTRADVTLPAAIVFSTRLDNARSWVYARTTDVLAQRHEDLETRARQEAERTLEQAALDGGILERARVNAERTVASFVRSLGYTAVTVTSKPAR